MTDPIERRVAVKLFAVARQFANDWIGRIRLAEGRSGA